MENGAGMMIERIVEIVLCMIEICSDGESTLVIG